MTYLQFDRSKPAEGYWDQAIIKQLFRDEQVFVIPGAYQAPYVNQINDRLNMEPYAVVIISSDEEGKFPWQQIRKDNRIIYRQYWPADRQIPIGSPRPMGKAQKNIDYFYAGQVNHPERMELQKVLENNDDLGGRFLFSGGFTQGYDQGEYKGLMAHAKIVPCPAGWIAPDSFRLYEALESGCTPVILEKHRPYFEELLGAFPFPVIDTWARLKDVEYQDYSSWWNAHKNSMVRGLKEDLEWLKSQFSSPVVR